MKRRILYVSFILVILTVVFVNTYLGIQYGINLFEPLNSPLELNEKEKAWIKQHGKIIYGADYSSPPLRYIDENSGQYCGFIVDYIFALSIELGVEIDPKPTASWDEALHKLENKESDFFDMIPSENRGKIFSFSDKVYTLRGAILVSEDERSINDFYDLAGKTVIVPKGDYAIDFLNTRVKGINFIFAKDMKQAIMEFKENKADAVVGDEPVIIYYRDKLQLKNDFRILDNIMYENEVSLAVPKSEKILLSILNKGIRNLERKDLMTKIQQKWFGIAIPSDSKDISEKITLIILIFIFAILLILYLSYSWNKILKNEVEKRTEELLISKNNLQTTFDGLTHLLVVVDKDLQILNVNESFCQETHLDREQLLGQILSNIWGYLPDGFDSIVQNTLRTGQQYVIEFTYKQKIYKLTSFPLKGDLNQMQNVLIMIQDVTQIRLSEQQLLQDRKMVAIGQLAAGVAHEIRNPLGLIRNYCYVLKNSPNKEKTQKSVHVIEASVEKASEIIDNLLNFSRISCDRIEPTNIYKFIVSIVELQEKVQQTENIRYLINCNKESVCNINQESLKHIMTNLISNGIDAMSEGGILTIDCHTENNRLLIECSDKGCGISTEDLNHIFNPFFTTKKPGKGVGLGLYITFNEVQKCGGEIRVVSKLNQGTTFFLVLPIKE